MVISILITSIILVTIVLMATFKKFKKSYKRYFFISYDTLRERKSTTIVTNGNFPSSQSITQKIKE